VLEEATSDALDFWSLSLLLYVGRVVGDLMSGVAGWDEDEVVGFEVDDRSSMLQQVHRCLSWCVVPCTALDGRAQAPNCSLPDVYPVAVLNAAVAESKPTPDLDLDRERAGWCLTPRRQ
jgi:hypothetical protein